MCKEKNKHETQAEPFLMHLVQAFVESEIAQKENRETGEDRALISNPH